MEKGNRNNLDTLYKNVMCNKAFVIAVTMQSSNKQRENTSYNWFKSNKELHILKNSRMGIHPDTEEAETLQAKTY